MRRERAEFAARYLEEHHSCIKVVMVANAIDLLRERGLPIPAWTVPADSWTFMYTHEGFPGVSIASTKEDEHVMKALRTLCPAYDRSQQRFGWTTVKTWRCPTHERDELAS